VNGTSLAWIAARTTTSGRARVYLDGAKVAMVDLKSTRTKYRQVVWAVNGLKAGRHTVKIVVDATCDRPEVIVDGVVSLS
jgi:hypothetical protein